MTSGLRSGVTNNFTATGWEPYLPEYTLEKDPVPRVEMKRRNEWMEWMGGWVGRWMECVNKWMDGMGQLRSSHPVVFSLSSPALLAHS